MIAIVPDRDELVQHGVSVRGHVYWHPTTSQLYEHALARGEARLAEGGPLVIDTGRHTGALAQGQPALRWLERYLVESSPGTRPT